MISALWRRNRDGKHLGRYQTDVMLITIVILVALVQILQGIGMISSRKLDRRIA